jgi:GT2 family glycosyltransferase
MNVRTNQQWNMLLDSFRWERDARQLKVRYPAEFYPPGSLEPGFRNLGPGLGAVVEAVGEEVQQLTFTCARDGADLDRDLTRLFASFYQYPLFERRLRMDYTPPEHPLVSCIIVLTANDLFVAEHLIPSLLHSTAGTSAEIIVVCNGLNCDRSQFRNCRVLDSDFGQVARAYNQGAAAARGELLAFFHDDCLMNDPTWVSQSLLLLATGRVLAVTPEVQEKTLSFRTAKCVPLIIRRQEFLRLGGFDEELFIGYEDADFSYTIYENGGQIAHLPLAYLHFSGMSSILMFLRQLMCLKHFFACFLIPREFIRQLATYAFYRFINHPVFALATLEGLKRINEKHKPLLTNHLGGGISFPAGFEEGMDRICQKADRLRWAYPDLADMDSAALRANAIQLYQNPELVL